MFLRPILFELQCKNFGVPAETIFANSPPEDLKVANGGFWWYRMLDGVLMIVPANFHVPGTSNKEDRGGGANTPPPPGWISCIRYPGWIGLIGLRLWYRSKSLNTILAICVERPYTDHDAHDWELELKEMILTWSFGILILLLACFFTWGPFSRIRVQNHVDNGPNGLLLKDQKKKTVQIPKSN